jgi:hypothetical protein
MDLSEVKAYENKSGLNLSNIYERFISENVINMNIAMHNYSIRD